MLRKIAITVALLLAVVAGIASASVMTPGSDASPRDEAVELPAATIQTGEPVADPRGGPPWAVRVFDAGTALRCVMPGRTDGKAFGPVDKGGRIQDTGRVPSGSCAPPGDEPLQVGIARYADTAGTGPRSVLFGIADASVVRVEVAGTAGHRAIRLDSERTFAVVSEGLAEEGAATISVTLSDGTSRDYRP